MAAAPFDRRLPPARAMLAAGAAFMLAFLLCGLGWWQVERLAWKLDLIERVNARVGADPVQAPGPQEWAGITRETAEYRRVRASGHFLHDRETAVLAVTESGRGYWIMTPLVTGEGFTILVNRGFVSAEYRSAQTRRREQAESAVEIAGLLRMTEPEGGFLRVNDPQNDRWYSRDVAAIAAARGLGTVAPYFIDADATADAGGRPIGGLTVIAFSNNHLGYAATWFVLALMTFAAGVYLLRDDRRRLIPLER